MFTSLYGQFDVSGVVLDDLGHPLPSIKVIFVNTDVYDFTDEEGRFRFKDVEMGSYLLMVEHDWYSGEMTIDVNKSVHDLELMISHDLELDQVVISSLRFGGEGSPARTIMNKEDLEGEVDTRDMPFVIQYLPSVVTTSDAGSGIGYTAMRIRGTDQTRINVTINGIPLNDAESQQVFFVDLPDLAAGTESIEVQRGVGSSTNGAAAFGASVNISTNWIHEKPGVRLTGGFGSFNTKKAGLYFHTGKMSNGFYLDGRMSLIESDGYIDRSAASLRSFALSPAYVGEHMSLRYNLIYGHERTQQAWFGIDPETLRTNRRFNPAGSERTPRPYEDQVDDYLQVHHQLHFNTQWSDRTDLGISLHYTPGSGFFEEYKADQLRTEYGYQPILLGQATVNETDLIRRRWLDNHFYGGLFSLSHSRSADQWVVGGGLSQYNGAHFGEVIWAEWAQDINTDDRYYDNTADKLDGHLYMKWRHNWSSKWSTIFDMQYRGIQYHFEGPDVGGTLIDQSDSWGFFNPKIEIQYRPGAHWHFNLFSGLAGKEPNRDDYVESTPNSRPEAEYLWDTEGGVTWSPNNDVQFGVNLYYMRYRDQLVLTGEINDVGAATRMNIPRSHRLGVEFIYQIQNKWPINVEGNVTWSRNRIQDVTLFFDQYDESFNYIGQVSSTVSSTPLPYSPHWIVAIQCSKYMEFNHQFGVRPFINGQFISQQFIDLSGDDANTIDAYDVFDAGLSMNYQTKNKKIWTLQFRLNNVFSKKYSANAWSYPFFVNDTKSFDQGFYPQALRHYYLGLTVEL